MVAGDLIPGSTVERWPLYDVHGWPVVPFHIEIARREITRLPVVDVARDCERLQKDFRHDHGAADVQRDAAAVECFDGRREPAKIAMTRVPDCGAVRR